MIECGPNDRSPIHAPISAAARTPTDGPPSCDVAARPFRTTTIIPTAPSPTSSPSTLPFFRVPPRVTSPERSVTFLLCILSNPPFFSKSPLLARPSVKRGEIHFPHTISTICNQVCCGTFYAL